MQPTGRDRRDILRIMEEETVEKSREDIRSRRFLFPKRILWTQGEVENSGVLLQERDLQISLAAHEPCVMRSTQDGKASILLDYGVELHGGIRILAWEDSTGRGAKGMSTFMGYYILTARAMAGDYAGCLNCIREYWGGMLALGATTFWEDFDVDWMENASPIDELPQEGKVDIHACYGGYCYQGHRHSFCHGWAGGATPWLSENVLGIKIKEPGCKKIAIEPHLEDLKWARGTYPTPYGEIEVSHVKRKDGSVETLVSAPKEIEIIREE